nr:zinc finger, CCHC-type, retrotransposon Gag domain protein [Tanacetum cinerariifolium]
MAAALSLSLFLQIDCGKYCIRIHFRRSSRAVRTSIACVLGYNFDLQGAYGCILGYQFCFGERMVWGVTVINPRPSTLVSGCADEFKARLGWLAISLRVMLLIGGKLSSKPKEKKYEREYHTIRQKDGELTDVAQVANAGRNIELLRERGGVNNKRNRDRDRIHSANKNNNQRGYGQRGNDGRNYNKQGGNSSKRFYQQNRDQRYNRSSGSSRQKKYTDYTSPPPCDICGKTHPGKECYRVTGACFSCGLTGHMAKDCPKNNRGNRNDK